MPQTVLQFHCFLANKQPHHIGYRRLNVACRTLNVERFLPQFLLAAAFVSLTPVAVANSVEARSGNIYFVDASSASKQLTSTGHDTKPMLAPGSRWVVFIRTVEGKTIQSDTETVPLIELWQVRLDGKDASLLVRARDQAEPKSVITAFDKLQFSSNGKLLYFTTPAWATSGAVHVIDTTNRKEHFLCPGSDLKVVPSGEYKDCLLVLQHRYFIGSGSYDWYWLLRPDGTEIGPVGEDTQNFESTLKNE